MKTLLLLFAFCALGTGLSPAARADDGDQRPIFEISAGAGTLDVQKPAVVAIVQMRLNSLNKAGGYMGDTAGPKIDVQLGFGTDGVLPTVPHADIAATLVRVRADNAPAQLGSGDATTYGFEGLTINYQREIGIDLDHTMTVSLAGAWIDSRMTITPGVKLMVKALIDLASAGYARRLGANPGELQGVFGWTPNFDGEVGFELLDHFRIVLGERAIVAFGGSGGTVFDDQDAPKGTANSVLSRTSLTASANVTRHLTVFLQGNYAVYAFNGRPDAQSSGPLGIGGTTQGADEHAEKGEWQLIGGVGGQF